MKKRPIKVLGFVRSGGSKAIAAIRTLWPLIELNKRADFECTFIESDQMTVTLADEPVRYARITFAVVLPEGADSAVVGDKMPLLKDGVLDVVAGLSAADLVGQQGLDSLRSDLTAKALEIYTEGEVLRVDLTEVLVQ